MHNIITLIISVALVGLWFPTYRHGFVDLDCMLLCGFTLISGSTWHQFLRCWISEDDPCNNSVLLNANTSREPVPVCFYRSGKDDFVEAKQVSEDAEQIIEKWPRCNQLTVLQRPLPPFSTLGKTWLTQIRKRMATTSFQESKQHTPYTFSLKCMLRLTMKPREVCQ